MHRNSDKIKIVIVVLLFVLFNKLFCQNNLEVKNLVNLNVGLTTFKNQFKNNYTNRHLAQYAKAATVGLEILNKKTNLSIELRKTYWLGINASSFNSDVTATASYNQVGVNKYFKLNSKRKLVLGLSHIWIAEYDKFFALGNANNKSRYYQTDTYWTSKSISTSVSINLTQMLFTELKFNYYYFIGKFYQNNNLTVPKKGINDNRIQFSIIYKITKQH